MAEIARDETGAEGVVEVAGVVCVADLRSSGPAELLTGWKGEGQPGH